MIRQLLRQLRGVDLGNRPEILRRRFPMAYTLRAAGQVLHGKGWRNSLARFTQANVRLDMIIVVGVGVVVLPLEPTQSGLRVIYGDIA